MLQNCNKIVFEPVQGIKLNSSKILNSTPTEYMAACPELMGPFRSLYFLLTFYHAVVNERKKYQSLGWSHPYEFTHFDNQLACHTMLSAMNRVKDEPWRAGD